MGSAFISEHCQDHGKRWEFNADFLHGFSGSQLLLPPLLGHTSGFQVPEKQSTQSSLLSAALRAAPDTIGRKLKRSRFHSAIGETS